MNERWARPIDVHACVAHAKIEFTQHGFTTFQARGSTLVVSAKCNNSSLIIVTTYMQTHISGSHAVFPGLTWSRRLPQQVSTPLEQGPINGVATRCAKAFY
jgi:hypothetical protein